MRFSTATTVAVMLALWAVAALAHAQPAPAWREGFEGPKTSWQDAGGDAQYRILDHQRLQGDAHSGTGCEWLRLEANGGSQVYFAHQVGRPRVIDDLTPSVWIKSDRPGVQLAARIVLPRSIDPQTGWPVTAIVTGSGYTDVGRWQQLRIERLPHLLTQQVHLLRMQLGPQVDDREAVLDVVLLNVYGGPGTTNVWIDDLELVGYVASQPAQSLPPPNGTISASYTGDAGPNRLAPVRLPPVNDAALQGPGPRHTVKLVGSVLLVDGRPMFPRVVQHRGEPLEALKKLGFNAVWLQRLPGSELLAEADHLGLWLICPPPRPVGDEGDGSHLQGVAEFGPQFDCVLAWDLGGDLSEAELAFSQQWAEQVRTADRRGNRPLICRPRSDLRGYSRPANLLLIDRRPLGTSLELSDYAAWVRRQPLLASLGTPVWTTVQTQPNEALREQLAILEPGSTIPMSVSPEQIRLLAYTALASGSRGLLFASDSPLDASDPDARQRAMTLELLNLELELLEPWAAAGNLVATAEASVPEVVGTVLGSDHSRLLLPLWCGAGAQCVPSQSAVSALTVVAPGVPEASNVYELTPHGIQSLRHQRVAGGVRVTLPEFGLTAQVLLAHDPLIIEAVNRRAAQIGRRAAELQRNLAVHKLITVQAVADQLAARTPVKASAAWFDAARKHLQLCDGQLASGDVSGAALSAQRAARPLRMIERAYWNAAMQGLASPVTSPAALSFDTLPHHWRMIDRLRANPLGANRLESGNFEDGDAMFRAGWRYFLHAAPTVRTTVDLVRQAAHSGQLGLRLATAAADPEKPPSVIEIPPIQFVSPAVPVEAGQIICIHGWVQVPSPITGSSDGLLIIDSLGGETLADRVGRTEGWRQFALYRVAPHSGPMYVTFALSGIGEAWLDDVEIQVVGN